MTPDDLYLEIPCGRCEAKISDPCVTVNGNPTTTHAARCDPIDQAYAAGYEQGEHDANLAAAEVAERARAAEAHTVDGPRP